MQRVEVRYSDGKPSSCGGPAVRLQAESMIKKCATDCLPEFTSSDTHVISPRQCSDKLYTYPLTESSQATTKTHRRAVPLHNNTRVLAANNIPEHQFAWPSAVAYVLQMCCLSLSSTPLKAHSGLP